MDWLGFFCLGIVIGCAAIAAARAGLKLAQVRPTAVLIAALLLAGSAALIGPRQIKAIAAFPPGLVVAMLWMTLDVALRNTRKRRHQVLVVLGYGHLTTAVVVTAVAAWFLGPLAANDLRLENELLSRASELARAGAPAARSTAAASAASR